MKNPLVASAEKFAVDAHGSQLYGGKLPYVVHLRDVAMVLAEFGHTDDILQSAAYLHDTLEDTSAKYSDVKEIFGEEIAEIVYAVTDELGRNRIERHRKTYPKIKQIPKATIVKLADRIANTRASVADEGNTRKLDMYRKEYKYFRGVLHDDRNVEMWEELDRLSAESK